MELEFFGLAIGAVTATFSFFVGRQVLELVEQEQRRKQAREAEQIDVAIRAVNNNNKALALESVRKLGKLRGVR